MHQAIITTRTAHTSGLSRLYKLIRKSAPGYIDRRFSFASKHSPIRSIAVLTPGPSFWSVRKIHNVCTRFTERIWSLPFSVDDTHAVESEKGRCIRQAQEREHCIMQHNQDNCKRFGLGSTLRSVHQYRLHTANHRRAAGAFPGRCTHCTHTRSSGLLALYPASRLA